MRSLGVALIVFTVTIFTSLLFAWLNDETDEILDYVVGAFLYSILILISAYGVQMVRKG